MVNSFGLQEWELKYQFKQDGKIHQVWVVIAAKDLRTAMKNAKAGFNLSNARVKFTIAKRLK